MSRRLLLTMTNFYSPYANRCIKTEATKNASLLKHLLLHRGDISITYRTVDTDNRENDRMVDKYNVQVIPTTVLEMNGKLERIEGVATSDLTNAAEQLLTQVYNDSK
jgi:protein-disulfide isomerase-like protein with CxxC motif